ncbi:MAG: SusD/RagB family nutrient-binding outer membrane lipoprotein [Bacteroidales bacterium]|nr:SusD/RagB family nutrient-binding outer membrane lipoprotein [Bacteroidales bacterium]
MKKTQILAAAALLLLAGACTKNFEQYNANPYGVTNEEMLRDGYALRAALNGMASAVISTDVNTTQFTECLLGGPMGGYLADSNQGFRNTISNFNPTDNWTNVLLSSDRIIPTFFANYGDVRNLTEDPVVLAIADVIKVAVLHRVADTYGPIPYSQIGVGGKIQVPYDSQEQAYKNMLADLDRSIAVLTANRGTTINASADIIYGGQVEKWAKFANSLKLRLAMRMVYADPATAKKAAEEVAADEVGAFASNDDNALYDNFNANAKNPFYVVQVEYNGGDSMAAADIITYMNGYNDPRRAAYFNKSQFDGFDYVGLRHGIVMPANDVMHRYSAINISMDSPFTWMNAAEVAFLKAEAVAVFGFDMGGSAKEFYEQGVRLSFAQWGVAGADAYLADATSKPAAYVDPIGSNSYDGSLSEMTIAWEENASTARKQEKILIQKWIANWLLGNESWCDIRRTGYPHILPATAEGNKSNGLVDSAFGARRMKYPSDEYVNNGANLAQAVTLLGGADEMATRTWFDCNPNVK